MSEARPSIRQRDALAALVLTLASAAAVAVPPADVVACPPSKPVGTLAVITKGAFSGSARAALTASREFAAVHGASTASQEPWLRSLAYSNMPNRILRSNGHNVLVMTVCAPGRCADEFAYVGFDLGTKGWGAQVYRGRIEEVPQGGGSPLDKPIDPEILNALICAANADLEARK